METPIVTSIEQLPTIEYHPQKVPMRATIGGWIGIIGAGVTCYYLVSKNAGIIALCAVAGGWAGLLVGDRYPQLFNKDQKPKVIPNADLEKANGKIA